MIWKFLIILSILTHIWTLCLIVGLAKTVGDLSERMEKLLQEEEDNQNETEC